LFRTLRSIERHGKVDHNRPEDTTMPAPATITDEQIRAAGQDIVAAGRRVTAYSLRAQLSGRGEPRRLMSVWEQMQPHRGAMQVDHQPQAVAAPPLSPDLAAQAALLRDRLTAEFDGAMATAWAAAERRAADRLGGEVAAARAAAEVARLAQTEADEALATADTAWDAAEADRHRLVAEAAEARATADRASGRRPRLNAIVWWRSWPKPAAP
jgi:hypothetical protein